MSRRAEHLDKADLEEMFVASLSSCHMLWFDSLHHRTHERCFIANSVSCPVEVESRQ